MSDPIRQSYLRLPFFMQPLLTWVSGVPYWDQEPLIRYTPVSRLALYLLLTFASPFIGLIGFAEFEKHPVPAVMLISLSVLMTTSGMRRLDVSIIHQSLHYYVTRNKYVDHFIGQFLTTILIRNPFGPNRREHMYHHGHPCTHADADVRYLRSRGHIPNTTPKELTDAIIKNIYSPSHHLSYLRYRLVSNFAKGVSLSRKIAAFAYLLTLVLIAMASPLRMEFIILWVIPLTVGFQAIVYFYTLSEHRWWLFGHADNLPGNKRQSLTFGRSTGDPLPESSLHLSTAGEWLLWWCRLLFLHIPYRAFIFVGDTVHHDLHHVRPGCDWANSAYVRRDLMKDNAHPFELIWGGPLDHIIEAVISPKARQKFADGLDAT